MKRYKTLCAALVVLNIHLYVHGSEYILDSATIKVQATSYKNKIACLDYFPGTFDKILNVKLDSNGAGAVTIPVKKKVFVYFFLPGGPSATVFIDGGYNLTFKADHNGKRFFTGKGSAVNNYLLRVEELANQFTDSANAVGDINIDKFVQLANRYQKAFDELYKKHYVAIAPDKELNYLLKAGSLAYLLATKETYLRNFTQKEIDSLHLEHRMGLDKNNLLDDTLLIKNEYLVGNFGTYLFFNRERYIGKTVEFSKDHDIEIEYYTRCFNAVENAPQYGKAIKEYQLFNSFSFMTAFCGPSAILDSIALSLKEKFPNSYDRISRMEKIYKEFANLTPGNLALPLQGISLDGKVVSLTDFKGKVIFIDIWATWCGGCIGALPKVLEIQKNLKENNEVVFIFLSNDRDEEKWKRYLVSHPEFQGIHLRAREEDRELEKAWNGAGIPRYIIIDRKGNIVNAFADKLTAEKEIKMALIK